MVDLPTVGRFVGGAGYAPLTETSLRALVSGVPACRDLLKGDPIDWKIREVGDGNLNLVFIVTSGAGGVVVKQALPYVRLVGESWPLPLDRAHFEHEALKIQAVYVPMHVPKVYKFEPEQAATVMAYLSPHIILRKGLIRRVKYPQLADICRPSWAKCCSAHPISACQLTPRRGRRPCYARTPPCAKSAKTSSSRTPIELLP
jgi:5-methylthioribose kinase